MVRLCLIGICFLELLGHVVAPGGHSKMCLACSEIHNPAHCTRMEACHDGICVTDTFMRNGRVLFSFSCHHHCEPMNVDVQHLIGKRLGHHDDDLHVCRSCCADIDCEKTSLCESYYINRHATTTTTTTPVPTTPDGISCRNYESDVFHCKELDKYNFCTDTASIGYAIAHEKCSLHCGFCSPDGSATLKPTAVQHTQSSTQEPSIRTTHEAAYTSSSTPSTIVHTTAEPIVQTTPEPACVDIEVHQFNCSQWQEYGFCENTSAVGHTIALERCRKTCGFCSDNT